MGDTPQDLGFIDEVEEPGLVVLARQCLDDTKMWFPRTKPAEVQDALWFHGPCMMGEAGEFVNKLKKVVRGSASFDEMKSSLVDELTDTFTYMLSCAGLLDVDLIEEYFKKREFNSRRFGKGATSE